MTTSSSYVLKRLRCSYNRCPHNFSWGYRDSEGMSNVKGWEFRRRWNVPAFQCIAFILHLSHAMEPIHTDGSAQEILVTLLMLGHWNQKQNLKLGLQTQPQKVNHYNAALQYCYSQWNHSLNNRVGLKRQPTHFQNWVFLDLQEFSCFLSASSSLQFATVIFWLFLFFSLQLLLWQDPLSSNISFIQKPCRVYRVCMNQMPPNLVCSCSM